MTITSPQNPHLKELRRLQRRRERDQRRLFFAEGEDLVSAAHRAGWLALSGYRAAGTGIGDEHFLDVQADTLAGISTLGSGTRVIGVYEQRWIASPVGPLCVYLHGLSDPGNLGTVLRSAQAFGASCVALGPDCADPYSPKAVRASMGAIFQISLARVADIAALPGERVALVPGQGGELSSLVTRGELTLLVGAEREGLPRALSEACEHVCHIPIASQSLNAAMAATIALYQVTQHFSGGPR
ncbi:MAG TPA: RNA methyltransferase [Solirubrobacteraceae bacterium]|jgi:TrmH family RNA methyltransferase